MIKKLRKYFGDKLIYYYYASKGKLLYNFTKSISDNQGGGVIDLIKKIKSETEMLLADQEAYLIYTTVKKLEKIEGDIAEVGVYKGGSAKLIREATQKPLYLFDTFEGLPEISEYDSEQNKKGIYSASLEEVKDYLKDYKNIHFYKGIFPETTSYVEDKKFSFVHLDVDIYQSTLDSLKFFYPRIVKGGVVISHDYRNSKGVKKAFDDFFQDKPEIIIQPFTTDQCLIVKV